MDEASIQLGSELSNVLGEKCIVTTEGGGVRVFDGNCSQLFYSGRVPRQLTAAWLAKHIALKLDRDKDSKARRSASLACLKERVAKLDLAHRLPVEYYETSFGFSVSNLFTDGLAAARQFLAETGIAYRKIEYSSAHWVVRVYL